MVIPESIVYTMELLFFLSFWSLVPPVPFVLLVPVTRSSRSDLSFLSFVSCLHFFPLQSTNCSYHLLNNTVTLYKNTVALNKNVVAHPIEIPIEKTVEPRIPSSK